MTNDETHELVAYFNHISRHDVARWEADISLGGVRAAQDIEDASIGGAVIVGRGKTKLNRIVEFLYATNRKPSSGSYFSAFRQINRSTGNHLRQQLIDDVTREPVEAGEKARGFEVGKNQYLLIEDDELDAVTIESNHTIEIDSFVPREQMDERYLDSPYYLVPNESVGQEAFERVVMLQPWDKGLVGTTLRYPYEVRDAKDYFDEIPEMKLPKDMLQLAEHILETKSG